MNNDVIGLGLESSCDETAASIVINGERVVSNKIYSQIELHSEYSGVVPEIASRAHLEKINYLVDEALKEAKIGFDNLSYVSATNRPGLVGSLLIALQSAKAISYVKKIPLIGINHLEAHMYAPFLEGNKLDFPFIGLLISGGNTVLYKVNGVGDMDVIGKTVDDAIGEAFDKVSKYLELGYPGGPIIEKMALLAKKKEKLFPKLLTKRDDKRFSYSGLKTAVVTYIKGNQNFDANEVSYSFQETAFDLLQRRLFSAARELGIKNIVVAGGVAANKRLKEILIQRKNKDENIMIPSLELCTDNAAMVSGIGYHYFLRKNFDDLSVDVQSRLKG